jgi:hypothetical protein
MVSTQSSEAEVAEEQERPVVTVWTEEVLYLVLVVVALV